MYKTPSAFSISHYVVLFIFSTLCTISVVWVLIAANNREAAIRDNILRNKQAITKTCQKNTADNITTLWKKTPQKIPPQYMIMEKDYANRIVPVRTTGNCNGERFICNMGQIRSVCDPCAKNTARKRAMFQHISDSIDQACQKD